MNQKKKIRKLNKILSNVRACKETIRSMSNEELSRQTAKLKQRLEGGERLDALLPEAFATVCEADRRILGKDPYDAQIIGGIALHQGYLAEMNTGEGKTLVATMPLYLNALTEKSTILVTTNEYLAIRDAEEMGQVYNFLGLSVAVGVREHADERITNEEKKAIYSADIVYTTHGALGFDYLFNNLVTAAKDRFMRELYYVIIDEADSVLLDSAQMPLVISGSPRVQSNLYELADFFVTTLKEGRDYETEEKKVWLTAQGIRYAEGFFGIDNFYGEKHFEINRHVMLALRAHVLFEFGEEYMISAKDELTLLDGGSGRLMPGVKLRGGMHQALEMKEKLEVSQESRSVASITYQNLFLLFPKVSGMSGTISDAAEEIMDVYHLEVLTIPPNRPVQRVDFEDCYFQDAESQVDAAMKDAIVAHKTGQPVLIVVSTIAETENVSKLLTQQGIAHNVLNANNAFWEAAIIAEAGQKNAVTVATSMAGRGTDIKLGEGVAELGGLAVFGIGRMANIRQERQARGRSGRQGDPGFSRFYVSLLDSVVTENSGEKLEKLIRSKKELSDYRLKKLINQAQALGEEYAVMARKQATSYDQVLQRQRTLIYAMRDELLQGGRMDREQVYSIAHKNIARFLNSCGEMDVKILNRYILDNISYLSDANVRVVPLRNRAAVERYLLQRVEQSFDRQLERLGSRPRMNEFMRLAALTAIDDAWVEQVDYLQQLQSAVSGRTSAQRNPVFEYQNDALESFQKMEVAVLRNVMRNILLSNVYIDEKKKLHIVFP